MSFDFCLLKDTFIITPCIMHQDPIADEVRVEPSDVKVVDEDRRVELLQRQVRDDTNAVGHRVERVPDGEVPRRCPALAYDIERMVRRRVDDDASLRLDAPGDRRAMMLPSIMPKPTAATTGRGTPAGP